MSNPSQVYEALIDEDEFRIDVLRGLRQQPRSIPPKYFYDARGSRLFDLICSTPEYYPTRTETGILEQDGAAMVEHIGKDSAVIELGSGSAIKTPLLLQHLSNAALYIPIDICEPHLRQSTERLQERFPNLPMQAICADYMHLPMLKIFSAERRRRVFYFPGSTIGNCTPDQSIQLLKHLSQLAGENGALLIGVDCKKSNDCLNAAYNDTAGYTAAFNLNLLLRMQKELGAQLNPGGFAHHASYNMARGRMEMHLVSQYRQYIRLDGETFHFDKNESIHTENSYKYTPGEFQNLAYKAGWQPVKFWHDNEALFSVHYLTTPVDD